MRSLTGLMVLCAGCVAGVGDDDGGGGPGGKGDGTDERAYALNDVSILFPLPAGDAERARVLWLMPRAGEQGPYFPVASLEELPTLNADLPRSFGYPSAMVTSLRFDPCFPRLGGATCEAQLRLVAQPVLTSATGVTMLEDAAVHMFFTLSGAETEDVLDALTAIRRASPVSTSGPLRVHPGLVADGDGATGDAVRKLVVEHCREDNFLRVTANTFAFDIWTFAKLEQQDGKLVRQPLPAMVGMGVTQAWMRGSSFVNDLDDPTGMADPAPLDGFPYLLSGASFANGEPRDAAAAAAAADRLLAIENPMLTSTEDVDCASCHVATQARLFASRNGVAFDGPSRYTPPAGIDTSLVLAPELRGNVGATISFGYHKRDVDGGQLRTPSISQRTINESAAIAEYLAR